MRREDLSGLCAFVCLVVIVSSPISSVAFTNTRATPEVAGVHSGLGEPSHFTFSSSIDVSTSRPASDLESHAEAFQQQSLTRPVAAALSEKVEAQDLAETEDVQISSEIKKLAVDELGKDPLKIFLYVYNEVGFVPYGWSLQGSSMTLSTGHGNDYDTASLLIALYRAAGIPARYVQGFVKVSPQRLANWVGAEDTMMPMWICNEANMIAVPNYAANGTLADYSLVHSWVKAYIGGRWVELDASFKEYKHYRKMDFNSTALTVFKEMGAPNSSAALKGWLEDLKPEVLSRIMSRLNSAISSRIMFLPEDTKIKSITGGQVIVKVDKYVSPPPAQDPRAKIESTSLTPNDRYYVAVMFHEQDPNAPGKFSPEMFGVYNVSTISLAGKRMTLSFPPATMKDHEVIEANGGLLSAPCNLFMVRPTLMIDGKPVLAGDPMKPGAGFPYKIVTYFPAWVAQKDPPQMLDRVVTSGSYVTISLHLGKLPLDCGKQVQTWNASIQQDRIGLDDAIGGFLNLRVLTFWSMMESYRSSISQSYEVADLFKLPSVAQSGLMASKRIVNNVEYLERDYPFMDVNLFFVNLPRKAVHPAKITGQTDDSYARNDPKAQAANSMYSLVLSHLEAYIFYLLDDLPPTGALHQILLARQRGIPIHFIAAENFNEEINKLKYDEYAMQRLKQNLRKEVDQKHLVIIPEKPVTNEILRISVADDVAKYQPTTYRTFEAAGYLSIAESGLWVSNTIATFQFSGGFPGLKRGGGQSENTDVFDSSKKAANAVPTKWTVQAGKWITGKWEKGYEWVGGKWVKLREWTKDIETVTNLAEQGSRAVPRFRPFVKVFGKWVSRVNTIVTEAGDWRYYMSHSRDGPAKKIGKTLFVGAVGGTVANGASTLGGFVGAAAAGGHQLYGNYKDVKLFTGEGMNKAFDQACKGYSDVSNHIDDAWKEKRRKLYGEFVFNRRGAPQHLNWPGIMMLGGEGWDLPSHSAIDTRTVLLGIAPVQAASNAKRGPSAWLVSSNGLTAGSDYNGFETTVDIPNVFHGNMTSNTFEFHVWNPPPDKDGTYRLAVSNKEGTSTIYYVDIELLGSDKAKFHKRIELKLQKGEEVLVPLRITSNPATGELALATEEPKPAYTVAFGIEPPIAGFMPEVFLDDKLLAPLSEGTYKVLAFEKGTKHTIKLNPTVFRFENGTQVPLQPQSWEFTESGEKIFQYTSRTPSTPQSQIMDYLPYIGVAAVVIVAVFALVRRRRKPAEAKTIKISEEAQPRYCINCGAKISKETKYCIECGREQD